MKVFVAGASGAIGSRLVPALLEAGHDVVAATRSSHKVEALAALGARPAVVDGLNRAAVIDAVVAAKPDVIVHQMSALASMRSLKRWDDEFALTNRLRTEGTEHLLAAARQAGVGKLVVQSYAGWPYQRVGGRVKAEDAPLDPQPPKTMVRTLDAIRVLENRVLSATDLIGVVLRYGSLYGPGTALSADGEIVTQVRHRKFPVVGNGKGVWSFIHLDDVASATRLAVERELRGVFNIVDDEPADVSDWLPELARILGAKPPRRVPEWLGRLAIGGAGVSLMTSARGASNAKAKAALDWRLIYPTWREGFRRGLSAEPIAAPYPPAV